MFGPTTLRAGIRRLSQRPIFSRVDMEFHSTKSINLCPECGKPMMVRSSNHAAVCCSCSSNLTFSTEQVKSQLMGDKNQDVPDNVKKLTPRRVYESLQEYVIGQDHVKKILSVSVFNHFNVVAFNVLQKRKQEEEIERKINNSDIDTVYVSRDPNSNGNSESIKNPRLHTYSWETTKSRRKEEYLKMNQASLDVGNMLKERHESHNRQYSKGSDEQLLLPEISAGFKEKFNRESGLIKELDKSNVLLLGPTGSGKTLLAKTLSRILDVPLTIFDATSLTQAGYVGDDVESILFKLYQEADFNLEKAEKGIIYIDEIDKISRSSNSSSNLRDVSGEGVQQALLKILEGTVCNIPKKVGQKGGGVKGGSGDYVQFNTANVLFICGGAFAGIEKNIRRRINVKTLGFTNTKEVRADDIELCEIMRKVEPEDLVSYGLIPEFVGRFSHVVSTNELSSDELCHILTEPKNALVKQYKTLFALQDVNLEINEDAIEEIAKMAIKRGTGARGLRSIMDKALTEIMFDIPEDDDVESVLITKEVISENAQPVLVRKQENLDTSAIDSDGSNSCLHDAIREQAV